MSEAAREQAQRLERERPDLIPLPEERQAPREALASQETWDAALAAIPCPDCADGDCEEHPA